MLGFPNGVTASQYLTVPLDHPDPLEALEKTDILVTLGKQVWTVLLDPREHVF